MLATALVIGLLGGGIAVLFRMSIQFAQQLFWQVDNYTVDHVRGLPWYWLLCVPAVGGLIVGLIIQRFAPEAKGHGVPEVLEAIALRGGRIRARLVLAKLVASGICIGSGGSVGREGPIVQIGSAFGSAFSQWLGLSVRLRRTLTACGAAAGIAATFNAPVAGAFFAAEIILGDFAVSNFSPLVISSVSATIVSRYFLGDVPAFVIPRYALHSPMELIVYAVLGVAAALAALLFVQSIYKAEDLFDRIPVWPPVRAMAGGAAIGVMGLAVPEVLGVGYETISEALTNQIVVGTLLLLVLAKTVAVSLTLGSGGSGGVFAPSLFIGAALGGAVGGVVHEWWPAMTATSGAYALVGLGAVVAAATHAPITAILIIFELTGDYKIIIPLMISCIIATALAMRIQKASIYTLKLLRRGVDLERGKGVNLLKHKRVRDIMRPKTHTVPPDAPLLTILSALVESSGNSLFVVGGDGALRGTITMEDLRPLLDSTATLERLVLAVDVMKREYPVIRADDSLDHVMRRLSWYRHELPVVEGDRLVGTVWPEDVVSRYNAELFKREMEASMGTSLEAFEHLVEVPGPKGLQLIEMPVPEAFVGKPLREVDLRHRYESNVLLVRRSHGGETELSNHIPDGDFVFTAKDTLFILGPSDELKQLMR